MVKQFLFRQIKSFTGTQLDNGVMEKLFLTLVIITIVHWIDQVRPANAHLRHTIGYFSTFCLRSNTRSVAREESHEVRNSCFWIPHYTNYIRKT